MAKYLDENGLSILWNKIVSKIGDAIPSVDTALSSTSTNPVQNKAIYTALNFKADEQLPMEITTTEGDSFRSVGDAIVGINDAMLIMADEIPHIA